MSAASCRRYSAEMPRWCECMMQQWWARGNQVHYITRQPLKASEMLPLAGVPEVLCSRSASVSHYGVLVIAISDRDQLLMTTRSSTTLLGDRGKPYLQLPHRQWLCKLYFYGQGKWHHAKVHAVGCWHFWDYTRSYFSKWWTFPIVPVRSVIKGAHTISKNVLKSTIYFILT